MGALLLLFLLETVFKTKNYRLSIPQSRYTLQQKKVIEPISIIHIVPLIVELKSSLHPFTITKATENSDPFGILPAISDIFFPSMSL